ncbi:rhodanese-like domain-containing protein [Streptomyces sp. 900116325]
MTHRVLSVLVREHAGDAVPYGVLTGDALFIGDVGRPDLLASSVRNCGERSVNGQIDEALHIPLGELPTPIKEIDPARPVVLHCAGGHRSSIAASLLRHHGHADVSDVLGGYGAWAATS